MLPYLLLLLTLLFSSTSFGLTFYLPQRGDNIVGEVQVVKVQDGDNIYAIARQFDIGLDELKAANPTIDTKSLSLGQKVIIPGAFILPLSPHNGIVINLPELRLYYYPPYGSYVMTFPIGIGKEGWSTPVGQTSVLSKEDYPNWYPPESIREYTQKSKGYTLPKVVPAGPGNPLGDYAIHLEWQSMLIHGTNQPTSVGQRSSSGCIRMYPEDVAQLFSEVQPGTPVYVVYQPYKVGWYHGELYEEVHKTLKEYLTTFSLSDGINQATQGRVVYLDQNRIEQLKALALGYPILVGRAK
ncbi:MAG: L,D-transpeptidase family protein [Gammaproteobacteria bacterium]